MARLLIVEDEVNLRQSMRRGLEGEGHEVETAGSGQEARRFIADGTFDAVILDLLLPDGDGLDTLQYLRAHGFSRPILIVTALDSIQDRIAGLDRGADDYLVKPFAFGEFLARIRALLRREAGGRDVVLHCGELRIDLLEHRVTLGDHDVPLTRRQYELLEYLVRHQRQVVTREMLARDVWKSSTTTWTNVIEVQINQLRKKLRAAGGDRLLQTIRGEGYRVIPEPVDGDTT